MLQSSECEQFSKVTTLFPLSLLCMSISRYKLLTQSIEEVQYKYVDKIGSNATVALFSFRLLTD